MDASRNWNVPPLSLLRRAIERPLDVGERERRAVGELQIGPHLERDRLAVLGYLQVSAKPRLQRRCRPAMGWISVSWILSEIQMSAFCEVCTGSR